MTFSKIDTSYRFDHGTHAIRSRHDGAPDVAHIKGTAHLISSQCVCTEIVCISLK